MLEEGVSKGSVCASCAACLRLPFSPACALTVVFGFTYRLLAQHCIQSIPCVITITVTITTTPTSRIGSLAC